jgi:hypothetical protein
MTNFPVHATTAAAVLLVGVNLTVAPSADAASGVRAGAGIYDIKVESSGMDFHINDPNLVLQPDVEVGPYAAAAALDNVGRSTATAGAPELGDYVGPLFGHFNGLGAGQIPPFPPVPGEVRSSYPGQPSGSQENHGYSIEANSTQNESKAAVNLGPMAPGANNATLFSFADAAVDNSGVLNAVGASGVDLLNFGNVLDIANVSSRISMTDPGVGDAKYVTTTDVGTITVSGQKFGLDQNGLTTGGTSTGSSADQVNKATEALKQAGLSIRYIPSTVTYDAATHAVQSMESGAVAVSYQHDVPSQGLTTTTFTLGYVALTTTTHNAAADVTQISRGVSTAGGAGSVHTTKATPARLSNSARHAAALPAAVLGGAVVPASEHPADGSGDDQSVAIITPTLKILRFGATTGTPDTCNIIFGIMGTGATQAGIGAGSAPAFAQAVDQCTAQSTSWGDDISGAMPKVAPLAVINPAVDPGIEAFAKGLESIGQGQAQTVAPFGPTLVGMADSARFFKGCGEKC